MGEERIDGHDVVRSVEAGIEAVVRDVGVRPDLVVLTSAAAEALRGLGTQLVDAGGDMTVCGLEVEVYDPPQPVMGGGGWGLVTFRKGWEMSKAGAAAGHDLFVELDEDGEWPRLPPA